METRPPKSKPPRRPLTWRKLFHRGIVCWLVAWVVFTCTRQVIRVDMKGGGDFAIAIGDGAVSLISYGDPMSLPTDVFWQHEEIWSPDQLDLIWEYPEILVAKLGKLGMMKGISRTQFSFPIAGLLWLWLAAGIYGEMKLLKHPAVIPGGGTPTTIVGSRKRVAALGGAMLMLSAIIAVGDSMTRSVEDARTCVTQIIRIRSNIRIRSVDRSLRVGDPLPWDEMFATWHMGVKYRKCPCGEPYQFSPVQLPVGEDAVRCPHEEHRRFLVDVDGSD